MSEPREPHGSPPTGGYLTTYSDDYRCPCEQTPRPPQLFRLKARNASPPMIPSLSHLELKPCAPSPFAPNKPHHSLKNRMAKTQPRVEKTSVKPQLSQRGAQWLPLLAEEDAHLGPEYDDMDTESHPFLDGQASHLSPGRVNKATQLRPGRADKATQLRPGQVENAMQPRPAGANNTP